MRLCAVQIDTVWEDKPSTHARVEALLEADPPPPGALIVLPEMFATGFSMDVEKIAEAPGADGPTTRFLKSLAVQYQSAVVAGVVGPGTPGTSGKGRNQALAIGPDGGELARYVKMHPFSFAREHERYEPGQSGVALFDWAGFRVSPLICYDLRFPEAFRAATRRGAQLLVVIANWPTSRIDHWEALLRARAIENQAYVAGVNRCGSDPNVAYNGQSLIFDPRGREIARAGDRPAVLSADIDLAPLMEYRAKFPALADIRPELLGKKD